MSARPSVALPKYGKHAGRNLARVRIQGKDFYLGEYDSPESYERYDQLIAEFIANGRRLPSVVPNAQLANRTVDDVLLAFWQHAEGYYVKDGKPTKELVAFKYAMRAARELYGSTPAMNFGPLALKAIHENLIKQDLCRSQVNARINRIKRIFKWAVSEELVPPSVFEGLRTVAGLRFGRSHARESEPVKAVAADHVQAVLPYVSPQVAAMIQLQALTGMRAGEVVTMRPCDLDCTGEIWVYSPAEHKTAHRGFQRQVPLGAKSRAILQPFLSRDPKAFLFSPQEAEDWRNERRREFRKPNRKTKIYPSELRARSVRKQKAKQPSRRPKRSRFDVDSYRRAITYGLEKARKLRRARTVSCEGSVLSWSSVANSRRGAWCLRIGPDKCHRHGPRPASNRQSSLSVDSAPPVVMEL